MTTPSDLIAYELSLLFNGPATTPLSAFTTTTGTPDTTWDLANTSGVGMNFFIGCFVQNTTTGILYRCLDATPGAAVWSIVVQENT